MEQEEEPVSSLSVLTPLTTLGRGSYGKVVLCERKKTDNETDLVAVKVVAKARLRSKGHVEKIVTESRVMNGIGMESPFLVGCLGNFQTKNALFFVLPYCPGGELFFHLQKEGRFKESKARHFAMQIALGLEHLHNQGIVYRDLKPENVLFTIDGRAQLADFGLSKFLPRIEVARDSKAVSNKPKRRFFFFGKRKDGVPGTGNNNASTAGSTADADGKEYSWGTTRTRCGTPAYQPPEIVEAQEHGLEVDWWAFGVLLYEMIFGEPPFMADDVKSVYVLIMKGQIKWPKKVSDEVRDLISRLLTQDKTQRLGHNGVDEVKAHAFFDQKKLSWEDVETLKAPPALVPQERGLGDPRDAIFFHAEFTSEDVREYVPPLDKCPPTQQAFTQSSSFVGFQMVPEEEARKFLSDTPIPVVEKGAAVDDLKKNNNVAGGVAAAGGTGPTGNAASPTAPTGGPSGKS